MSKKKTIKRKYKAFDCWNCGIKHCEWEHYYTRDFTIDNNRHPLRQLRVEIELPSNFDDVIEEMLNKAGVKNPTVYDTSLIEFAIIKIFDKTGGLKKKFEKKGE